MEKVGSCYREDVISELTRGWELANQLKNQLQPGNSNEKYDLLMEKIVSSYDNALKLLNSVALIENRDPSEIESRNFLNNSPRSHLDPKDKTHKDFFKKRKMWDEQARVCSGTELDGPLNDGYSWRKYGQKYILGTNHPRAYYRCTHRSTQGCLATKQVQRTDDDSSIIQVVYKGKHSCIQESIKLNKVICNVKEEEKESQRNVKQKIISIETSLKIETQELDTKKSLPFLPLPSRPIESNNMETHFFSDVMESISYLNTFMSPATSDSYFSPPQCPANDFVNGSSASSESDFTEMVYNETPITLGDLDLSTDLADFDSDFIDSDYFK